MHTVETRADEWPATRAEGQRRLAAFVPSAGRSYATTRNYDLGPHDRTNVSALSPYLRHRLITEAEVIDAVLGRHSLTAAEKFIDEVCWRTYWKGWLEQRPEVWAEYAVDVATLTANGGVFQSKRMTAAVRGETGIACFDAWAHELVATGYLHNHARMWFASIWIFTFGLPWQLGADFFFRHLLDGDPASNTLSWRWVAGQHTIGKTYLARADNIKRYTNGRFPFATGLAEVAVAPGVTAHPSMKKLPPRHSAPADGEIGLLLTEDDLAPETWPVGAGTVVRIAALTPDYDIKLAPNVLAFKRAALGDAMQRSHIHFGLNSRMLPAPTSGSEIIEQLRGLRVVTATVPVGPGRTALDRLRLGGLAITEVRRDWDDALWPCATKSFFNLKSKIIPTLRAQGIGQPQGNLFA